MGLVQRVNEAPERSAHNQRTSWGLIKVTAKGFKFRLYVTGRAPNAIMATENLTKLCDQHLRDNFELEVVDLTREPSRAAEDKIDMTPTLIRVAPEPALRLVGNLNDEKLILGLLS